MYDIIVIRHLCNKTIVLMGVSYVFNIIEYQCFFICVNTRARTLNP